MLSQGTVEKKSFIFDYLKKKNLLKANGQPTKHAIESGIVKEAISPIEKAKVKHPSLIDFKNDDLNINDKQKLEIKPKAARKQLQKLKKYYKRH